MEERDFQVKGFKIRLPLDVLVVASANPEDYTRRGRIITPLKDRYQSQIRTHYPPTRQLEIDVMKQERRKPRTQAVPLWVPLFIEQIVAELTIQARKSVDISQVSGVSVRASIANYETLLARPSAARCGSARTRPCRGSPICPAARVDGRQDRAEYAHRQDRVGDPRQPRAPRGDRGVNELCASFDLDSVVRAFEDGWKVEVGTSRRPASTPTASTTSRPAQGGRAARLRARAARIAPRSSSCSRVCTSRTSSTAKPRAAASSTASAMLLRYSRWDGTQRPFSLAAEAALDELARHLMEGMSVDEALSWMRYQGFELAGQDFRVMGVEELLQQLRQQARELMAGRNLDHAFDERWQRLRDALDREERAAPADLEESQRLNEFRAPRAAARACPRLRRFETHEWEDPDAEAEYRELVEEQGDIRSLEDFQARNRQQLRGGQSLSFEQALELMRQVERLGQMARNLLEGNFESISLDDLRELAGEEGVESLLILRDLRGRLGRPATCATAAGLELTPRAIRRIGELALEDIYGKALKRSAPAPRHAAPRRRRDHRRAQPRVRVRRARAHQRGRDRAQRAAARPAHASVPVRSSRRTSEVWDTDQQTDTRPVLLLDMSWSMSWSGRWPAAKRVAIAMDQLIRTRYPRDRFFTVGFYTRARELRIPELPELVWNMEDPFTNLQDGLRVAQRLIDRFPSANKQIIVITDGQPTAYFVGEELRVEWPSGVGGTSPRANKETLGEVSRVTRKGITINTFMLDDSPELMRFVEAMTRINKGRAFYTTPGQIGEYVMVDYLSRKRRKIR
jgi:uncharacterized protein with von Willebrand factor type A (vWA) domain